MKMSTSISSKCSLLLLRDQIVQGCDKLLSTFIMFMISIMIHKLTPGGDSTVHIYKQTVHRTAQLTTRITQLTNEQHN